MGELAKKQTNERKNRHLRAEFLPELEALVGDWIEKAPTLQPTKKTPIAKAGSMAYQIPPKTKLPASS
ncbi:MAG: hypothetical protein ABGY95_12535 [Rubritalea sp.]|uniref:hypothetical protein n=1 Tax=Rubritalea sp. TaxID=2109375 RepID=UPI0032425040